MEIIQNKEELIKYHNKVKSFNICINAIEEAINSVDPFVLIQKSVEIRKQFTDKIKLKEGQNYKIANKNNILVIRDVKRKDFNFNLDKFDSIHIVGAGKATAKMAIALEEILLKKNYQINSGAINIPYNEKFKPKFIKVTEASHPIPDKNCVKGTKYILDLLKNIKNRSIVFVLISGGASALLCSPTSGLELKSKQRITELLLKSGASIHEINKVRKHLSNVKGGNLVRYVNDDTMVVALILSDVVGDDLNIIGSGPTIGDNSTYADAISILKKYRIWEHRDKKELNKIVNILEMGYNGYLQDLPRPNDPIFKNVCNILIGNNEIACKSAVSHIEKYGVKTFYLGSDFTSEAKIFGKNLANILLNDKLEMNWKEKEKEKEKEKKIRYSKSKNKIVAFVLGGETVVKIESSNSLKKNSTFEDKSKRVLTIGEGGRNQESLLSSVSYLNSVKLNDFTILCCGTDGIDGNSNYAGGIV
ncbi:MAG: glycerate kinase, partial [Nitrososphaeraceae archaeon]